MPKYIKGQRVQIISARDDEGKPIYPDMEAHVGKSGVIVDYYSIGFENQPSDYYVYEIKLDDDRSIMAIQENALEVLMDSY
jgi:hypothetical protein